MDNPCLGCNERHVGCHSGCAKYLAWCESEEQRKSAEDAAAYEQRLYNAYVQQRCSKRVGRK